MGGFKTLDFVILVVYLLCILGVGLHFSKKEMQGKEFFKGDGTIPWWVSSVSIFATLLSPISFLGLAGNSFKGTWILWLAAVAIVVVNPIVIKYFLPVYSKLEIDTAYHYLELRFNKKFRVLGSLMFIVYQIGRMAIIMYLPAVALSTVIKIDPMILILMMGIIAIIYCYIGGLKSVLWTDFAQGVVLIGGVIISCIYLFMNIDGGIVETIRVAIQDQKIIGANDVFINSNILKDSMLIIFVGAALNHFAPLISSQDIVQRFTTTTDMKSLKKMSNWNVILSLLVATTFYVIGTGLYVFYNQNPAIQQSISQDQVYASFIGNVLPVGLSGLILASLLAAAQSTLSTGLNSVATSWTLDIQKIIKPGMTDKEETKLGRYISLGVGILSIVCAMFLVKANITSAYQWFNGFMGLVLGVIAGVFVLGVFCKSANSKGALIGFISSGVAVIYVNYFTDSSAWVNSIISISVCVIVGFIASKFFKQDKSKEDIEKYTYVSNS